MLGFHIFFEDFVSINAVTNYFVVQKMWDENSLRRKNKAAVIFKTQRFDFIDSAVIIISVSKAV